MKKNYFQRRKKMSSEVNAKWKLYGYKLGLCRLYLKPIHRMYLLFTEFNKIFDIKLIVTEIESKCEMSHEKIFKSYKKKKDHEYGRDRKRKCNKRQ